LKRTSEQFKAAKAFKYKDSSQPTVDEIRQKESLGLILFGWEKRILVLAGLREKMYQEQKECEYCKTPLELDQTTIDHKHPLSRGGTDDRENLVICCKTCNMLKGDMTVAEFIAAGRDALLAALEHRKALAKVDRKFKHINFQICYMKGPHLC
jgi:5-methylcytosine-specific restriction endonuclease McrA